MGGHDADEVAQQGNESSRKEGGGQQHAVVGIAQHETCDMGYGESYERHRTAEGGGDGGEESRGEEHYTAHAGQVHAQVHGILLPQQQGIEGLGLAGCQQDTRQADGTQQGQTVGTDIAEAAHAPVDITVYILHRGKEVEQGDDGGGQVPHHDTQDEQYEVALHEPRQQEVEERDAHGPS